MRHRLSYVALPIVSMLVGCGASTPRPVSPAPLETVDMEELRITAQRSDDGSLEFDSYDAEGLFTRATQLLNSQRCSDAVVLYDRLADEFAASRYRSPALYNAGLCLQDTGMREEAVTRFRRLVTELPDSADAKHAMFQLAHLYVDLERWQDAVQAADSLLALELSSDERVEAMARRAQGLLGDGQVEGAARQGLSTVSYYRTRDEADQVRDEYFAAAANYVLAETFRLRAAAVTIPEGAVDEQRVALEERAGLMLEAQRQYSNTIQYQNAHWAAASGYQIGAMYDGFWEAIMGAPTPPPRQPIPAGTEGIYEEEYRRELTRMVKPLVRHAIRYWELTLMMIERSRIRSEWADRVREDLERARTRLLEPEDPAEQTPAAPEAGPDAEISTATGTERPGSL